MSRILRKKIIIICGHYGAGKTNIAVNLAMNMRRKSKADKIALVDLDVVNPYFRSADSMKELEQFGIKCIVSQFANTNVDAPSLPPEIHSIFDESEDTRAVIDVGGDAAGATVLGMFAEKINAHKYEMIYVVNKYRPLIADVEHAVDLARAIEEKSRLKITSIINNSNIGEFTTEQDILITFDYARKISEELNVPRLANTAFISAASTDRINNYTKKIF
jgi:MinD-like ATPase involved in chromosome partitioning or flagellar assembly